MPAARETSYTRRGRVAARRTARCASEAPRASSRSSIARFWSVRCVVQQLELTFAVLLDAAPAGGEEALVDHRVDVAGIQLQRLVDVLQPLLDVVLLLGSAQAVVLRGLLPVVGRDAVVALGIVRARAPRPS